VAQGFPLLSAKSSRIDEERGERKEGGDNYEGRVGEGRKRGKEGEAKGKPGVGGEG